MNKLSDLAVFYLTFDDVLIRPAASSVEPGQADISTQATKGLSLKLPILSAAMDRVTESEMAVALGRLGGLGIIHRNNTREQQVELVKKAKTSGVIVGAACGAMDLDRAKALVEAGCDVIVVDSAHGHNQNVIDGAAKIKETVKAQIIVGNIATAEAAKELVEFADAIKVGIGPGSICTTRIVAGVGVPQISAIMDVASVAQPKGVPVIADGGLRYPGDIAKALAAGASTVMLGSMLAGTDEAPGQVVQLDGQRVKEYRGMGSFSVLAANNSSDRYMQEKSKKKVPEGVEAYVASKGPVKEVIDSLAGALSLSFGYVGATTMTEYHQRAQFVRITSAGLQESHPHGVIV